MANIEIQRDKLSGYASIITGDFQPIQRGVNSYKVLEETEILEIYKESFKAR